MNSEVVLRVGRRGEIYTTRGLRERVGIRPGGLVRAVVEGRKLVIEAVLTIEDAIREPIVKLSPEEAERLSEEMQEEEGVYG